MIEHLDYNTISSSYDERYSGNQLSGIARTLQNIAKQIQPKKILEVGCGTGRWLSEFENYSALKVGVDLSHGMLTKCKIKNESSQLICSDANQLPFANSTFDLIYCVNAIHHFPKKKEFIFSGKELLNSGGVLSITGFDPRNSNDQWYVYNYFDGTYKNDLERYPSFTNLELWMRNAGFTNIKTEVAETVTNNRIGSDVFNDLFLRKDQASQLAMLSDEEYEIGINKMKIAVGQNESTLFPVHLTFITITGNT